jgi:hypothetical protein
MFAGDVARFRGTTLAAVKSGYGEGRSISAQQAFAAGMIDRIATLDDVIGDLSGRNAAGGSVRRIAAQQGAQLAAGPAVRQGETFAAFTDRVLAAMGRTLRAEGDAPPDDTTDDTTDDTVCPNDGTPLVDGECPDCGYEVDPESIPSDDEGPEARGGARAGAPLTPAESRPAQQARSHSMSDTPDTAAQRAALVAAETTRQNEIRTLCAENQIEADAMNGFLAAGMTMEAVSAEILKRKRAERASASAVRVRAVV